MHDTFSWTSLVLCLCWGWTYTVKAVVTTTILLRFDRATRIWRPTLRSGCCTVCGL